MKELGIPFRVVESAHIHEDYPAHLNGGEIAQYLAEHKSDAYGGPLENHQILVTADTIVWHHGRELGKPADREEAIGMIALLSGDTHQVFTGVCLRSAWARRAFYVSTDVMFSRLEKKEIEYYVDHYSPFDKAGAYGIQEWIGHIAVEHISGSYFNVMGLPVQKVYSELKAITSIQKQKY
jgi:septum formation protein